MNDHHLVTEIVDGKPVETIIPGIRPEPKKAEIPKKSEKADK